MIALELNYWPESRKWNAELTDTETGRLVGKTRPVTDRIEARTAGLAERERLLREGLAGKFQPQQQTKST